MAGPLIRRWHRGIPWKSTHLQSGCYGICFWRSGWAYRRCTSRRHGSSSSSFLLSLLVRLPCPPPLMGFESSRVLQSRAPRARGAPQTSFVASATTTRAAATAAMTSMTAEATPGTAPGTAVIALHSCMSCFLRGHRALGLWMTKPRRSMACVMMILQLLGFQPLAPLLGQRQCRGRSGRSHAVRAAPREKRRWALCRRSRPRRL